jgi:hypothetical protein
MDEKKTGKKGAQDRSGCVHAIEKGCFTTERLVRTNEIMPQDGKRTAHQKGRRRKDGAADEKTQHELRQVARAGDSSEPDFRGRCNFNQRGKSQRENADPDFHPPEYGQSGYPIGFDEPAPIEASYGQATP